MLHRRLAIAIFICNSIWSSAQVTPAGPKFSAPLRPLLQALAKSGVSGSLAFSGHCTGFPRDLPHMRVPSTSDGAPLQLARETFSDDPTMQFSQDPDGTIRMKERGISTELLDVKISHVPFETNGVPLQYAAYNPDHALYYAILRAPEVSAFADAHDIQVPFVGMGGLGGPGQQLSAELPHISGSMDNLTLSQALDRIVKTFPGIWVYENCPADGKRRVVLFSFYSLQNPGLFMEN